MAFSKEVNVSAKFANKFMVDGNDRNFKFNEVEDLCIPMRKLTLDEKKPFDEVAKILKYVKQGQNKELPRNFASNCLQEINFDVPQKFKDPSTLWNSFFLDRADALVDGTMFMASDLKRMKEGFFSSREMDCLLENTVNQICDNGSFKVIPTHYATKWFYKNELPCTSSKELEYATECIKKGFVTAIHVPVYGTPNPEQHSNHWILLCKKDNQFGYIFDPAGYEIIYHARLRANLQSLCTLLNKREIILLHYNSYHPKQKDNSCGPLVLKEAERWLKDVCFKLTEEVKVQTDMDSTKRYRKDYVKLLLNKTDYSKLLQWCLVCHKLIDESVDFAVCMKCCRRVHKICRRFNATEFSVFRCSGCTLIQGFIAEINKHQHKIKKQNKVKPRYAARTLQKKRGSVFGKGHARICKRSYRRPRA